MFKYTLIRNAEIIVVSHYGKYVGAEADEAILSILKTQTLAERRRLKFVIQDFFAVEEMDLHDTDVARRVIFFKNLSELFDTQDPEAFLTHLSIYQIMPERAGTCRYFRHAQTERIEARAIPRLPNRFNTEKITG
ncbi:hypothetical protein N8993_00120 [Pseudomonadales bacterium]|nr:hypothetical protein [Pseudomonadales bacterium]MDB2542480.1 hypothetical protein [Pseudomonadales bacterium]